MQFSSVQDINAPLDFVFDQVTDFETYESYALRVGAQVDRKDKLTSPGPGMKWKVVGDFRGKTRKVNMELIEYNPHSFVKFFVVSGGLEADVDIETMALTRKQSRMKVTTKLKPKTISARLILQSARLAKTSLNRKFNHRFWNYANYIENNYNKSRRA